MNVRATLLVAVALLTAACGGRVPLIALPSENGIPAADGPAVLSQATASCRQARSFSAEVALRGTVGTRKIRGRLLAGYATPDSAYLEATAPFGASAFIFAAVGTDATLLLPRDRRALSRGQPTAILEAVTGVALRPEDVGPLLIGCAPAATGSEARQVGDHWRVIPGSHTAYLHREGEALPWRLVSVVHQEAGGRGWRADYSEFVSNVPARVRLVSIDPGRFDLTLAVSDIEMNASLGNEVFRPAVPPGYRPITIEELRGSGPLADLQER